jgi:hypothetical protein
MLAKIVFNILVESGRVRSFLRFVHLAAYPGRAPGLQFRLNINMNIAGLPTKHSTATTVTNAACPIELPASAG